jgi:hypothetical protein
MSSSAPLYIRSRAQLAAFVATACCWLLGAAPSTQAAAVQAGSVQASAISGDAATLTALIAPEGTDTKAMFVLAPEGQGLESPAAKSFPASPADLGSGQVPVPLIVGAQGLRPSVSYEFAVEISTAGGPFQATAGVAFVTQPGVGSFQLPDGRVWELVSPPNKRGAGLRPGNPEGGLIKAAASGEALTYIGSSPLVSTPEGNRALEQVQNLAIRQNGQWTTSDMGTRHNDLGEFIFGHTTEYTDFSEELDRALVEPSGTTPLPPLPEDAEPEEQTLYLRQSPTDFVPLVTAATAGAGHHYGERQNHLESRGASADLSHIVFSSNEALTPEVLSNNGFNNLYEWAEGHYSLVSVLPNGHPASEPGDEQAELGRQNTITRGAISSSASADGTRVIWQTGGGIEGQHLYLRDMEKDETVELDAPQGGLEPIETPAPSFQGASSDGTKIFFTDPQRLTADSGAAGTSREDLYVAEVIPGAHLSVTVTDISKSEVVGEPAEVQGVAFGASEDGNAIYYVANGKLTPNAEQGNCGGTEGTCTLYLSRDEGGSWTTSKVVTLAGEDGSDWGNPSGTLATTTSRVSPDGRYLAFMSTLPLTGYDNHDAASGRVDQEVFLYDSSTGRLRCASCSPTGARPHGVFDPTQGTSLTTLLVDPAKIWPGQGLAGSLPPWSSSALHEAPYQPRYLSDQGRLFFNSADDLVTADTNSTNDVYEYEPSGISPGACEQGIAGSAESFVTAPELSTTGPSSGQLVLGSGCVALISSGTSGEESTFLDASQTGGDVFFLTTEALVGADQDRAFDIYDARICPTGMTCGAAPSEGSPTACASTEECRPGLLPPSLGEVPASLGQNGGGNLAPLPIVATKKKLTNRQKLATALAKCRRDRHRSKRLTCERQARRRYPVAKKQAHKGKTK